MKHIRYQQLAHRLAAIGLAAALTAGMMGCGNFAASEPNGDAEVSASVDANDNSGSGNAEDAGGNPAEDPSGADAKTESGTSGEDLTAAYDTIDADDQFTKRDLAGTWDESEAETITLSDTGISSDSKSVDVERNTATITAAGTYVLSGTAKDAQIIVDIGDDDKVQLVLDGVEITNEDTAAIFVRNADKVFVTLAEKSENTLSVDGTFAATEEANFDGVIFAKDDIVINGSGALTITSTGHGIVGKDDLKITGGTLDIAAADKGIAANDSIRIADGVITIEAGDDGLHADSSDEEAGYVYIAGDSDEEAGYVYIAGGSLTIASGDDGIHADGEVRIDGGEIDITESYEGIEGAVVIVNDGDISVISSDDGFNAAGGADGSGFSGFGGFSGMMEGFGFGRRGSSNDESGTDGNAPEDMGEANGTGSPDSPEDDIGRGEGSTYALIINGGTIRVDARGDGLDSNGDLIVTGGTIYVSGPTDNGNGAIDYGETGTATITGGTVIAVGSSGMAEIFDSTSTQCAFMVNLSASASGSLTIEDADGNVLMEYTPEKSYVNVVFSSPELELGETYTVTAGGSSTEVTQSDTITGGMGGFGGMMGGFGPGRMDGFDGEMPQMPEDFDGEMPQMPEDFDGDMPQRPGGGFGGQRPDGGRGRSDTQGSQDAGGSGSGSGNGKSGTGNSETQENPNGTFL